MKYIVIIAAPLLIASPAFTQQAPPDAAALQRLLAAVETQRNQALTQHAMAEARAASLAEDLAKAQARVKELESKPDKEK